MRPIIREVQNNLELQQVLTLRKTVFVKEQGIPEYLDKDGKDPISKHVIALDEAGKILAGGRLNPHDKETVGILSRISVAKENRGQGLGKKVIEVLENLAQEVGYKEVQLNPHKHLEKFYKNLGYKKIENSPKTVGQHQLIFMKKSV